MTRLYAALLVVLPRGFRARYGRELIETFELERREPRHRGLSGAARLWVHVVSDLAASAARQHARRLGDVLHRRVAGSPPSLPPANQRTEMDTILQDLRHALRAVRGRPGFTAVAVLSLGLGIGASTLIYGLVDGIVLTPFAFPDPDRLVTIGASFPKLSSDTTYVEALSPAEYADIRQAKAFANVAAFDLGNRNISGGDVPERVFTAFLLDDPFPVLGMPPLLGRGFTREELAPGAAGAVIISHRLWLSRFAADPHILGRVIRISGRARPIVGVMPPGLLLAGTDMWLPWGGDPARVPRNARQFTILARLAPGVTLREANSELALTAARIDQAERARFKEYEGWRLPVTPWAEAMMRDARPAAFVLLGAVAFVLLIACVNLTNLFLARQSTRQRELAVRVALGAGRARIARLLLTESLLVAVAGAALGLLFAYAGLQWAASLVPAQLAQLGVQATFSLRVLACGVGVALAVGLLVGLAPALQASRTDPHESLRAESRVGGGGHRVRRILVVSEVALSVALLLGAGLLLRSFLHLQRVDLGFEPAGVLTMRLTLPGDRYSSGEAITAFFEQLVQRVEAVPGVRAASMASQFPPLGSFSSQIEIEGSADSGTQLPTANTTIVSRRFFETLGIPLRAGQGFGPLREGDAPRVIVNQAFVERFLRGRDPIGARVRPASRDGGAGPWAEVLGVAADTRNTGVAAPTRPEVFIPMEHGRDVWNQLFLLVRADRPGLDLLPAVRQTVASLDPEQPVYAIQTLEEALAVSTFQARAASVLIGIFAAVALVMAAVGVYGVMAYSVSMRRQEIGVRLAIGARRGDVIWMVMRQVLALAAAGLVIGSALVVSAGGLLRNLLHGVSPTDPFTFAAAAALLTAVAALAGWIPARRAGNVDPIEALRYE